MRCGTKSEKKEGGVRLARAHYFILMVPAVPDSIKLFLLRSLLWPPGPLVWCSRKQSCQRTGIDRWTGCPTACFASHILLWLRFWVVSVNTFNWKNSSNYIFFIKKLSFYFNQLVESSYSCNQISFILVFYPLPKSFSECKIRVGLMFIRFSKLK